MAKRIQDIVMDRKWVGQWRRGRMNLNWFCITFQPFFDTSPSVVGMQIPLLLRLGRSQSAAKSNRCEASGLGRRVSIYGDDQNDGNSAAKPGTRCQVLQRHSETIPLKSFEHVENVSTWYTMIHDVRWCVYVRVCVLYRGLTSLEYICIRLSYCWNSHIPYFYTRSNRRTISWRYVGMPLGDGHCMTLHSGHTVLLKHLYSECLA